jgi:hypothetical protein
MTGRAAKKDPRHDNYSGQISRPFAAEKGICQLGDRDARWIAAGDAGLVRLQGWADPHQFRAGTRVGRVSEDGADPHIDSLAKKYLGQDKYPYAKPSEVRVMYEIEPTSASGMG